MAETRCGDRTQRNMLFARSCSIKGYQENDRILVTCWLRILDIRLEGHGGSGYQKARVRSPSLNWTLNKLTISRLIVSDRANPDSVQCCAKQSTILIPRDNLHSLTVNILTPFLVVRSMGVRSV